MFEALDSASDPAATRKTRSAPQDEDLSHGVVLLCRACGKLVTHAAFLTAVEGSSEHTRTNPNGYTFTFRTYLLAPGCRAFGEATVEHTWFPPHAWRIALCGGCGDHLGWQFGDGDGCAFHALITDRLKEDYVQ